MAEAWVMKKNLGACFDEWCARSGSANALAQMDGSELKFLSYNQLRTQVLAWRHFYEEHGVTQGDRVAMISTKCLEHFPFFHACWHMGAIAVPVCETLGTVEMSFILKDADPKLIIADSHFQKKVVECSGGVPVINLADMPPCGEPAAADVPASDTELDAVSTLIYTSGSTGMPKGVMLTHRNLWTNAYWAFSAFKFEEGERLISLLPYWHSFALVCEMLCPLMAGGVCAVPKDMKDFRRNLAAYQPDLMLAVPRVVETVKMGIDKQIESQPPRKKALIEKAIYNASRIFTAESRLDGGILRMVTHYCFYDPLVFRQFRKAFGGKLRCIVCGGAPLDLELQIFFKFMGVLVVVGYGLTETSPVISANLPEMHRLGSTGKVFPWLLPEHGGDYTFMDEDGNLGKDLHGQLLVKGDCVMKGYWRHTDASAKTMKDGWLNTGDVGHCDKDGFIYIHGRMGNMIVLIGGEKLHPEHVEDAVKQSPLITEAMVIGEKCKNVYVLVNVNDESARKLSEEELKKRVREDVQQRTSHLAAYQKPKDVLILPDFTMDNGMLTGSLKVRRYKIMEAYKKEIEEFLRSNGEEVATKHDIGIASSKVQESLKKVAELKDGQVVN